MGRRISYNELKREAIDIINSENRIVSARELKYFLEGREITVSVSMASKVINEIKRDIKRRTPLRRTKKGREELRY